MNTEQNCRRTGHASIDRLLPLPHARRWSLHSRAHDPERRGRAWRASPQRRGPRESSRCACKVRDYQSYSNQSYGRGRYSVVTTRDIETEADFAQLGAMPQVAGVGALNRLLLPGNLDSADELRNAAAQLQGDIVLMYTIDTAFRTDTEQIGPLQLVSLGFFPNKKAKVTSTCAVALIDTRTGYVYGVAESTSKEDQRSDLWNTEEAIEKARAKAERGAFTAALGETEKLWAQIVAAQVGRRDGRRPTPLKWSTYYCSVRGAPAFRRAASSSVSSLPSLLTPIFTVPPAASLPNSSSSASGRLI